MVPDLKPGDNSHKEDASNNKVIITKLKYFMLNYQTYFQSFISMNSIGTQFFIDHIDSVITMMKTDSEKIISILLANNLEFENHLNKFLPEILQNYNKENFKNFEVFLKKWCDKYPKILIESLTEDFFNICIEMMDNMGPFVLKPFFYLETKNFGLFVLKIIETDTFMLTVEKMTLSTDPSNLLRFIREVSQFTKACSQEIYEKYIGAIAPLSDILILLCLNTKNFVIKKNFMDLVMCIKESPIFNKILLTNIKSGDFFEGLDYKNIDKRIKIDFSVDLSDYEIKELRRKNFFPPQITNPSLLAFNLCFLTKILDKKDEKVMGEIYKNFNIFSFLFFCSNIAGIERHCLFLIKEVVKKRLYPDILQDLFENCLQFGRLHLSETFVSFPYIEPKFSLIVDLIRCLKNEGVKFEKNEVVNFWKIKIKKAETNLDSTSEVHEILENAYNEHIIRYMFSSLLKDIPESDLFTEFDN